MKILMINGSPRKKGANGRLLASAKDIFQDIDSQVDVEIIHLCELNMNACSGCLFCYKKGTCYLKDSVESIKEKMLDADGIIFSSPTYVSNVSYLMKLFMDRTHLPIQQTLYRKPCMTLVTYENADGREALKVLQKLIRVSGGTNSQSFLLKTPHNRPLDSTRFAHVFEIKIKRFHLDISNSRINYFDVLYRTISFHFFIKPHILKNANKHKGIMQNWIKIGRITAPLD